jgi:hypothetical protein
MARAKSEWRTVHGLIIKKLAQAEGWVLARYRGAAAPTIIAQVEWEDYPRCDHRGRLVPSVQ